MSSSQVSLPGFSSPSASTEVPLEMLSACHGRVQAQCTTLQRLLRHLIHHGNDADARAAATAVMRYFDLAAPHHHDDEEQDLFPALLQAAAGSNAVVAQALTQRLRDEHRVLEQHWQALRLALTAVAESRADRLDEQQALDFCDFYQKHIDLEEAELLPLAQRVLSDTQLDQIGRRMRERRGITNW